MEDEKKRRHFMIKHGDEGEQNNTIGENTTVSMISDCLDVN